MPGHIFRWLVKVHTFQDKGKEQTFQVSGMARTFLSMGMVRTFPDKLKEMGRIFLCKVMARIFLRLEIGRISPAPGPARIFQGSLEAMAALPGHIVIAVWRL